MSDGGSGKLEERVHEETLKRAREQWEREGEFEREILQSSFAARERHLQRALASREELLAAVEEEASGLRNELWRTRSALDDTRAQLATRPVVEAVSAHEEEEEEEEEEDDLIQTAVEHMKEQVVLCEEASPKPRRYYYPQSATTLPNELHGLRQRGLAQAILQVKEWVKGRALIKRARAKVGDEDSA